MKVRLGIFLLIGLALALSACGNSGGCSITPANVIAVTGGSMSSSSCSGSSNNGSSSSGEFTSFAAMPKPGTSTLSGITIEGSYTAPGPAFNVISHSAPSQGSGTVTLTVDGNGNATALTINGAQSSVTFSLANGSVAGVLPPNYVFAESADRQQLAIAANYSAQNFNYQT